MAHYGYTRFVTALDGSSANSSLRTSNPIFVGDASLLWVSYATAAAAASNVSIDASLSDGFQTTLSTGAAPNQDWTRYNNLAGATANALSQLTAGVRWLRFVRAAADSQASVLVAYRVT